VHVGPAAVPLDLLAERLPLLLLVDDHDFAPLDGSDEQASGVRADVEDTKWHRHPS